MPLLGLEKGRPAFSADSVSCSPRLKDDGIVFPFTDTTLRYGMPTSLCETILAIIVYFALIMAARGENMM